MDRTRFAYKDHSLEVVVRPDARGWTWQYVIDGQSPRVLLHSPLPTREMAIEDAVIDAEMVIDGLISTQYGDL